MRSECIKLVLVSFTLTSHHVALVLSILQKCLRGVHVLHEALVKGGEFFFKVELNEMKEKKKGKMKRKREKGQ